MKKSTKTTNVMWLDSWYPKILGGSASVALIASFWQAAERIHMLKDPSVSLNCNLNPIIDCGGVMNHHLAALFGFPNTFIGMVMFSMLLTSAIILLTGGAWTKKFHGFVLALSIIAIAFSAWFFWVSLYVIGKICLFCLAIWPASVVLSWYGLLYWWRQHQERLSGWQSKAYSYGLKNHYFVVFCVFLLMLTLFLLRFREYYFG